MTQPTTRSSTRTTEGESIKIRQCRACKIIFGICLGVSLGLIIGGFLLPPMAVIDGSVLTATGELIAFSALAFGFRAVELGYDLRVSHGESSMEISDSLHPNHHHEI